MEPAGVQVPLRELSHIDLNTPCVHTHLKRLTVEAGFRAVVQSGFIAALTHSTPQQLLFLLYPFWIFLGPHEPNCPSCLFLCYIWGGDGTLDLHSPEALRILCSPSTKVNSAWALHAFTAEDGRCWTPSSYLCALCVGTELFRDLACSW